MNRGFGTDDSTITLLSTLNDEPQSSPVRRRSCQLRLLETCGSFPALSFLPLSFCLRQPGVSALGFGAFIVWSRAVPPVGIVRAMYSRGSVTMPVS